MIGRVKLHKGKIMDEYTKISISKKWKNVVKDICKDTGLKMYHFEDQAIEKFIQDNYPEYLKNKN